MPAKYHLIYSPRIAKDLHGIFSYVAESSPSNGSGLVRRIIDAINSLELFPHRHPIDEEIKSRRGPVRVMVVGSYLIFYRVLDSKQAVELITVRHGARQRPKRL